MVDGKSYYYADKYGTSMSSPIVAGTIALWLEAKPDLDADDIKDIFANTAIKDKFVTEGNPNRWGHGKIDAYAGLKYILNSGIDEVGVKQGVAMVYPNPSNGQFNIFAQGASGDARLNIYNMAGALVYSNNISMENSEANVDVYGSLGKGIYILNLVGNNCNYTSRIIIK